MKARRAAFGVAGLLPALVHGLNYGPMQQRRLARSPCLTQRLHATRNTKDQEVDSPVTEDSSRDILPSKFNLPWKSFLGGLVGGIALSVGLAVGTHVEDSDGLYESTALFSNILTEVENESDESYSYKRPILVLSP